MKDETAWGLSKIWNAALVDKEERKLEIRDYLWASELGNAPIDTYLKMNATPYSNPANERSRRKFEAGNVFEWIVSLVLKRAGILKDMQTRFEHQYKGLLKVTGKGDFLAGGAVDIEKAKDFIEFLKEAEMPDVFTRCFDRTVEYLATTYPNGMADMPLEVKSVSSFAMDKLEKQRMPIMRHRQQLFHYLKSGNYEKGLIIYLCRDDLRMMEFAVLNPSSVEQEYKSAIEVISAHFKAGTTPPKEKLIVFDAEYGKFTKNFGVEWSPYLTMLYDFEEPRAYSEIYGKKATNWNRVMKRVKTAEMREQWLRNYKCTEDDVTKDKIEGTRKSGPQYIVRNSEKVELPAELQSGYDMTPANLEVLKEIEAEGFNIEQITSQFRMEAADAEEVTN